MNRASAGGVGVAAVAIAKEHRNKRVVSHRAVSRRVVRAGNRSANAGSTIECTPRRAKHQVRVMHPSVTVMRPAVNHPAVKPVPRRRLVKVASMNAVAVVEIVVNADRAVIVVPTERRASKAPAVIAEREAVEYPVIAGRVAIADLAAMEHLAIGERVAIADLAMAIQERVEIADLAAMEPLAIGERVATADLAAMEHLAIGERVAIADFAAMGHLMAIADLAMAIQERLEIANQVIADADRAEIVAHATSVAPMRNPPTLVSTVK